MWILLFSFCASCSSICNTQAVLVDISALHIVQGKEPNQPDRGVIAIAAA